MILDKRKFKANFKNIIFIFVVLIILILFTIFFDKKDKNIINEVDLDESGTPNISKLVINEVMSNNGGYFADEEGNVYDWVELYNGSSKDIDLNGYSLSDDESKIKWVFDDVTIKSKSYLIIYLSGDAKEGLYANFKLSKNGREKLTLKNKNGKVIDLIETVKTNENTSLARNLDGTWNVVKKPTPGFANTNEGYNLFINSITDDDNSIEINEILVHNGGQFTDNYGLYSGYIELKNISDSKVNLKNYSLSNNINEPFKWHLPDITLEPNEILLIYTSGKDETEDILHTSFKLDSKTGNVILSKNNKIVRNVPYENLANGYALSYIDGDYKKTGVLSGGYENNEKGSLEFSKKYEKNKNSLIINEVMTSNYSYLAQNGYNFYDWVELKNNSNSEINLSDYYITTSLNNTEMFKLPDVVLNPGELYVVMASGNPNLSNNSYVHTNFKLSTVESLYITKDGKAVDSMFISDIPTGYSYGRDNDFGFIYMESPSPNKNNNSGKYEVAYFPEFSIKAGIYNDVDSLNIELKAPGTIYYTLDGSMPTVYSNVYTGPINLTKTTIIKAMSIENEKINSEVITSSYIINENHTLPVMSVSLHQSNFNSLQNNAWNEELEYNAYAELFDGDEGFSIPCGLKLFGGSTRGLSKKSFSLKFRKKYGAATLNYQVFPNRDNSVYNTLVLRSGSQDYESAFIRDALMTSLMDGTAVDVQAYKPVILYINGKYWGVYNIREKVDEDFIASHYNVNPDLTNIIRIDGFVSAGTKDKYTEVINYVKTHNMANPDNYNYIKEKINIDSLITFWAAETYVTNNDIINGRYFSNPEFDDGRLHMIFYDLDYGMYNRRVNYFTFMTDPGGMSDFRVPTDLMRNLLKNDEFRQEFVKKLSELLNDRLSTENIISKIDELYNLLLPEMPRNQERWGLTMKTWNESIDYLKTFANERRGYLLKQIKSYFGLSNEEMKEYFGE